MGTIAALKVFTDRTLAMTDRNVVTVIMGDFSRSLPGSNHQANLTATVIGANQRAVKAYMLGLDYLRLEPAP